ncbi:hypothetical protein CMUST_10135 [Corynebacterium mustelae]|uniref:Uncharacterized protein n=1 Tax=Corynebacterium mustelae TaxID=571915 RepID=A0A0G3H3E2_9CORY|nr:hypothetical protein [Corynebacterium mustelae]AKK06343.1 hypothetical protein CMUST_10135 [Corynebacterium mustelae]
MTNIRTPGYIHNPHDYWLPTPPLWELPQFQRGKATEAEIFALLEVLGPCEKVVPCVETDQLLARLVERGSLDRIFLPETMWSAQTEDFFFTHVRGVLDHLGEVPFLLSEPSFVDLSISASDLVSRLRRYSQLGLDALETDLVLALCRIDVAGIDVAAVTDELAGIDSEAAIRAIEYINDPIIEPELEWTSIPHEAWRVASPPGPEGLLSIGSFPHFGAAAMNHDHFRDFNEHEKGLYFAQVARRKAPLSAAMAINLLAELCFDNVPGPVDKAVHDAWERGLLIPGELDWAMIHWTSNLDSLTWWDQRLFMLAEEGLLSVVWPVWDQIVATAATANRKMPMGTINVVKNMAAFWGVAPSHGIEALAKRPNQSQAKKLARKILAENA